MSKYNVGDSVWLLGAVGEVVDVDTDGYSRVLMPSGSRCLYNEKELSPVEFPIPADKDPWRESEPDAEAGREWCDMRVPPGLIPREWTGPVCSRPTGHSGHHIARERHRGQVIARWPQEAKPKEPPNPMVGPPSPVTATEAEAFKRAWSEHERQRLQAQRLAHGERGLECGFGMPESEETRVRRYMQVVRERNEAAAERDKWKREFENLKRSTDSEIGDLRGSRESLQKQLRHVTAERDYAQMQLERLKGKRR